MPTRLWSCVGRHGGDRLCPRIWPTNDVGRDPLARPSSKKKTDTECEPSRLYGRASLMTAKKTDTLQKSQYEAPTSYVGVASFSGGVARAKRAGA